MQSSVISKIEKARRYAEEPGRVTFSDLTASFRGEHGSYTLSYKNGKWHCPCSFFSGNNWCSHTVALQKMLGNMFPADSVSPPQT